MEERIEEKKESKVNVLEKLDGFIEKKYVWLFWSITSLALILWVASAFNKRLEMDDPYTLLIIRQSFGGIWKSTALDVHPPMYYWMLKIFAYLFKNDQLAGHLFSIIPCYLIITVGAYEIKKLFNKKTAILFIVAFMSFPFGLKYAIEVRMYSWCALYITFGAIYAFKIYKENKIKDWLIFAGLGLMSAYTQYFSFVSTIVIYLILFTAILINEDKRKKMWWIWVVCVIGSLALYAPWMVNFIAQMKVKVTQEYHIQPITVRRIFQFFYQFFKSGPKAFVKTPFELFDVSFFFTLINIGCYFTMWFLFVINKKKPKDSWVGICAVLVPIITFLVGVFASIIIRPVFEIRYMFGCVPLFCFSGIYFLEKTKNFWVFATVMLLTICNFFVSYAFLLKIKYELPENYITQELIQELPEHNAMVFDVDPNKSWLILQPFALYVEKDFYMMEDHFFPNYQDYSPYFKPMSTFDYTVDNVLLVKSGGVDVEEKYAEKYTVSFVRDVDWSGEMYDVYMLKLK